MFPLQYLAVFLVIATVVWLGDIVLRYLYHKTCQLYSSSSTLTVVQFRRQNGEEMVSLLEADNEVAVGAEHDVSVAQNTETVETLPEEDTSLLTEETIEND